jgi:hypothetical protein
MSSAVNLSKMLFDNTNFRTTYSALARTKRSLDVTPTPAPTLRRNVNPAFHLSRFISNAANTGPCRACGH